MTARKKVAKPRGSARIIKNIEMMLEANAVDYEGTSLDSDDLDTIKAQIDGLVKRAIASARRVRKGRGG